MANLKVLDASFNKISSAVPDFLTDALQQLYLDHNNLTGGVPYKYGNTPDLRCWSLDYNAGLCGLPPGGSRCFDPTNTSIGKCVCDRLNQGRQLVVCSPCTIVVLAMHGFVSLRLSYNLHLLQVSIAQRSSHFPLLAPVICCRPTLAPSLTSHQHPTRPRHRQRALPPRPHTRPHHPPRARPRGPRRQLGTLAPSTPQGLSR